MQLYCERIGTGGRVLLLLHGLAGNGAVWRPLLELLKNKWPGTIIVPDLRGHGRSPHAAHYGFGQYAADVAELLPAGEPVTVVGHSMGTVVALMAASGWYGVSIDTILGFGVKTGFTEAEKEKARSLAGSPVRWFESRGEAAERFLRLSGLKGLVDESADAVAAGVREENGRWRIAADPRTFIPPGQDHAVLLRPERVRLKLACGSQDTMVSAADLRRFDPDAVELPGLGHNFHVQAPEALAGLMDRLL
jgi:pimeloyl-ACP methyl ester carboxylesterase